MTLKFGFELEGFYQEGTAIGLPPSDWPTDGFPGLVEVRNSGGNELHTAYYDLLRRSRRYTEAFSSCFMNTKAFEHTFTPDQRRQLRKRDWAKERVSIENIYGRPPRALGNRTLASFQINFSDEYYVNHYDAAGKAKLVEEHRLFDYLPIIRRLDKEFERELKDSNRAPGWYAVKGPRVEYRSLPNFVFKDTFPEIDQLLKRLDSCFFPK